MMETRTAFVSRVFDLLPSVFQPLRAQAMEALNE